VVFLSYNLIIARNVMNGKGMYDFGKLKLKFIKCRIESSSDLIASAKPSK
jgi:hypothetical protein